MLRSKRIRGIDIDTDSLTAFPAVKAIASAALLFLARAIGGNGRNAVCPLTSASSWYYRRKFTVNDASSTALRFGLGALFQCSPIFT